MNLSGEFILGLLALAAIASAAGYLVWRSLRKSDDPTRLVWKWALSALLVGGTLWFLRRMVGIGGQGGTAGSYGVAFLIAGTTATCGILLGIIWASSLGEMIARPIANLFDGGQQELEPQPLYSIAEARRKQGKYLEAVAEIRKQLARFPGDATGLLMLAEIQAEDLNDLISAEETINRLVNEPGRDPFSAATALNRLADWHLKFGQDPDSARSVLERIVQMYPDNESGYLANQRIAHLTPREMLADRIERHPVKMGHYEQNVGLRSEPLVLKATEDSAALAAQYVKHLEQFPLDNEAREKLATIYAEHYRRLDLAVDQIEQLINQPSAPHRLIVHWLNLLADFQIKVAVDGAAARRALERIGTLFPNSAAAEAARTRIAHLQFELRAKETSQVVKLGSYGQNLGLKDRPEVSG